MVILYSFIALCILVTLVKLFIKYKPLSEEDALDTQVEMDEELRIRREARDQWLEEQESKYRDELAREE